MSSLTQSLPGPRVRIDRGTVRVFMNPTSGLDADEAANQPRTATQYVDLFSQKTVVGRLSKMEEILEYLKALYR